jgi:hypothetical protein
VKNKGSTAMIREFNTPARIDRRRRARLVTVAAVAVVAFVSVSCGDSDSSADPIEDTTTTAAEQPEETLELDVEPDDTVEETAGSQAQESEPDETGQEFIDLPYWEGFLAEGYSLTVQPEAECARPEPDVTVCEFELIGSMVASHIGHATEIQTGERTTYWSETCGGPEGAGAVRVVQDGTGTITSSWGDTLDFRVRQTCLLINWVADGGTGRFEEASGLMSGVGLPLIPSYVAVNAGTLTVKAELWEDLLPPDSD